MFLLTGNACLPCMISRQEQPCAPEVGGWLFRMAAGGKLSKKADCLGYCCHSLSDSGGCRQSWQMAGCDSLPAIQRTRKQKCKKNAECPYDVADMVQADTARARHAACDSGRRTPQPGMQPATAEGARHSQACWCQHSRASGSTLRAGALRAAFRSLQLHTSSGSFPGTAARFRARVCWPCVLSLCAAVRVCFT